MKPWLYAGLAAGLVPIQTTLLEHVSVTGIRPDVCLVASSLIGFFGGPVDGVLMGLLLGFEQDLFSAGDLGLNLGTKAAAGLLAGLAGRYVVHATPASVVPLMLGLSVGSGLVFVVAGAGGGETLAAVQSVLLPQAIFDTVVGVALYWLLAGKFRKDDALV